MDHLGTFCFRKQLETKNNFRRIQMSSTETIVSECSEVYNILGQVRNLILIWSHRFGFVIRFWLNFFAVLWFWMIFSLVLQFLIYPNVPLIEGVGNLTGREESFKAISVAATVSASFIF